MSGVSCPGPADVQKAEQGVGSRPGHSGQLLSQLRTPDAMAAAARALLRGWPAGQGLPYLSGHWAWHQGLIEGLRAAVHPPRTDDKVSNNNTSHPVAAGSREC